MLQIVFPKLTLFVNSSPEFEELFGITLQADTTQSQWTGNWKADLKGKGKLSWKQKDTDCKSGNDRLSAVTKIKEHLPKQNWSR